MRPPFPIVDLFAGPGGLGEGFSSVRGAHGKPVFEIGISIEKDEFAHRTLSWRALVRKLEGQGAWDAYLQFMQGQIPEQIFLANREVAEAAQIANLEARCAELGKDDPCLVDSWIRTAIGDRDDWVLIGGPPCQAYSMAGRSRRTREKEAFEKDEKHFLYREYLRIIRKFKPAVFVMENVKGMLSSTHGGSPIFSRILDDLSRPMSELDYEIRSFVVPQTLAGYRPEDYVIRSELYGIPQMRHRVILLGVRKDYQPRQHSVLVPQASEVTVWDMIEGLPRIRSRLTRRKSLMDDSFDAWINVISGAAKYLHGWNHERGPAIEELMQKSIERAKHLSDEGEAVRLKKHSIRDQVPQELAAWIREKAPPKAVHHDPRAHMESDLHRYLFASAYAAVVGESPKLRHFPDSLLPKHGNARDEQVPFSDRFRVQLKNRASTTVVSHIAKDGHYYIHPDPSQCRSLTVREAARLQTFPDNYFFMGNKTQQYHQVGNAVPPFLARQLGSVVASILLEPSRAGMQKISSNLLEFIATSEPG